MKLSERLAAMNYPFVAQKIGDGYYVVVPDLKGCSFWTSLDKLEKNLYKAKLAWIEAALMIKVDIPDPRDIEQVWTINKKEVIKK